MTECFRQSYVTVVITRLLIILKSFQRPYGHLFGQFQLDRSNWENGLLARIMKWCKNWRRN